MQLRGKWSKMMSKLRHLAVLGVLPEVNVAVTQFPREHGDLRQHHHVANAPQREDAPLAEILHPIGVLHGLGEDAVALGLMPQFGYNVGCANRSQSARVSG